MKHLTFDWPPDIQVTAVTRNVFDRLGLSQHLPRYEIITGTDDQWHELLRQAGTPVISCGMEEKVNVSGLLESACVHDYVTRLTEKGISPFFLITNVTNKVQSLAAELGASLLANPVSLRQQFENKAKVRELEPLRKLFPHFVIQTRTDLNRPGNFEQLKQSFFPFVIQNESEQLSGSRGTAIVYSHQDYVSFLERMQAQGGDQFVVSEFISGQPYSVQGCVTASGVFWGPIQQQIIADPWFTLPGFSQFCGGLWGGGNVDSAKFYESAEKIGVVMQERGYKGIFGIDFLLTHDGSPYVIEINARLTSMTPVLSMMQNKRGIPPLLLLHVLEHARVPYTLQEVEMYGQSLRQSSPLSYVVLHNRQQYSVQSTGTFRSGVYTFEHNKLTYVRAGYSFSDLQSDSEILIPDVPDHSIASGQTLVRIMTPHIMWASPLKLLPKYQEFVKAVESYFEKVR